MTTEAEWEAAKQRIERVLEAREALLDVEYSWKSEGRVLATVGRGQYSVDSWKETAEGFLLPVPNGDRTTSSVDRLSFTRTLDEAEKRIRFAFVDATREHAHLEWQILHLMPNHARVLSASVVPNLLSKIGYISPGMQLKELFWEARTFNDYQQNILDRGKANEPLLLEMYRQKFALDTDKFMHSDVMGMYLDPLSHLAATPDAAFLRDKTWFLVEIKNPETVNPDMSKIWRYLFQVQVQLLCFRSWDNEEAKWADVFISNGNDHIMLRVYPCFVAHTVMRQMSHTLRCNEFQQHVQPFNSRKIAKIFEEQTNFNLEYVKGEVWAFTTLMSSTVGPLEWTGQGDVRLKHSKLDVETVASKIEHDHIAWPDSNPLVRFEPTQKSPQNG
jgi:hypothetical protein